MCLDYALLCKYDELHDQWNLHSNANSAPIAQKGLEKASQQAKSDQGHNWCSFHHSAVHVPLGDHVLHSFVA